ncbi:Dyp-type peroxidase domain-containing protein [Nocardioides convexus]|uniref:Dyp-type peroxidase domain-containing protein n=1 Tax=Nocardioides convexus TaxID=2712224 RepID=UPI002418446E|nr:Dyp-type peroxidase domain-containing protein [Nocardioides convexus]
MMRLLSDDTDRLAAGRPALADTEPDLAGHPSRLTATFGFGPRVLRALVPAARRPRLEEPAVLPPGPAGGAVVADRRRRPDLQRRPAHPGPRQADAAQGRPPVRGRPLDPARLPHRARHRPRRHHDAQPDGAGRRHGQPDRGRSRLRLARVGTLPRAVRRRHLPRRTAHPDGAWTAGTGSTGSGGR